MTFALLASTTLRSSVVLLSALAAASILRRRPAALRREVLATGIVMALAVPVLAVALPSWHLRMPAGQSTPAAIVSTPAHQDPGDVTAPLTFSIRRVAGLPARSGAAGNPIAGVRAAYGLVWAWAAGALVTLLVLLLGLARLARLARRGTIVSGGTWAVTLAQMAAADPVLARVRLLRSDHPALLVAWGWRRPQIVLPCGAESWDPGRIRVVLEHEAEHIRRHDWPIQLAGEIVRALAWFNPLAWMTTARLRLESERACDDAVIARGIAPAEYAEHLVAIARSLSSPGRGLPAPAMARPSSLEKRVTAMLDGRISRAPVGRGIRSAVAAAGLVLTASIASLAAQSQFATVTGTVRDQLRGTIPGVTLSMTHEQSGARHEVKSDARGRFEFVGLPAGTYDFEAWRAGFNTVRNQLQVTGGQVATRDLTLDLGTLQETMRAIDGTSMPPSHSRAAGAAASAAACSAEPNSGHIAPPKKLVHVSAAYPPALHGTGRVGRVVLQATIGVDGTIRDIRTLEATGPEFEQAAAEAVRQWRFSQTLLNCVPVEVEMTVTTAFEANGTARLEGTQRLGDAALPPPPPPPPPAPPRQAAPPTPPAPPAPPQR